MSDFEDEHYQPFIFDPADSTIVSDPVAPQLTLVAFQGFAKAPRIFGSGYPIPKVIDNPNFGRTIQFT